jgi:hypothetical protein
MAVHVLWDAFVSLNSVDVSNRVKGVSLPMSVAELDATLMGSTTTLNEPGLKSFSCDVEFLNDFEVGDLDATTYTLWNNRTKFAVEVRPSKTSAVGTSNPAWRFTGFISSWNPIDGGTVGELAGATLTLSNSTALTRATS